MKATITLIYDGQKELMKAKGFETLEELKAWQKETLENDPCTIKCRNADVVTKECIDALLTEKIDHFTKNPEIVIKDYNANKAKYEEIQKEKEYIHNASPEEQAILTLMSKGVDVQGVLNKTKTLVDAVENGSKLVD